MYDKVDFWVSAWFLALIVCAVCPVPRWLCYTVFFSADFFIYHQYKILTSIIYTALTLFRAFYVLSTYACRGNLYHRRKNMEFTNLFL